MRNIYCTLLCFFTFSALQAQPGSFVLEPFANGFNEPVDIVNCGDDRIFVVEKDGFIKILDLAGNLTGTFMDINSRVGSGGSEQGLLGLAFHPDYAQNGYFFVNYTDNNGDTKVSRFSVSANPNQGNASSELVLLTIAQPYSNHNGGGLRFGHDGYLYIGTGDGGSAGDPGNRAQNKLNLLGKMLRIDVDNGSPYSVPMSNPFYGDAAYAPEIWALGMRNPWRWNFDRSNGDLWIGDVGQDAWEEVDYQPVTSRGGENYGWRCYEGNNTYNTAGGCGNMSNYDFPVFTYPNNGATGCAITGGTIYRGARYATMYGYYFTCDYCTGKFWWVTQSTPGNFTNQYIGQLDQYDYVGFGEDRYGEMYVAGLSTGNIWHIADTTAACTPVADVYGGDTLRMCSSDMDSLRCAGSPGFTYQWMLNGTPIGGATSMAYFPSTAGAYSVIVNNGICADTSTALNLLIGNPPSVSASGLAGSYCVGDGLETLVGSPAGGSFTGPGMSGDVFDPAAAGQGTHTIYYYYMDAFGCEGSDTLSTIVNLCPGVSPGQSFFPFSLSPNPAQHELFVSFQTPATQETEWKIVDMGGTVVAAGQWEGPGGKVQERIATDLPAGLYLLELRAGSQRGVQRFHIVN